MTQHVAPSIDTHIPVTQAIEKQDAHLHERPDLPVPSLWQKSVKVVHKLTKQPAIVARIEHATMQFRAYYPDQLDETGNPGRFASRTEWEQCANWDVEVTYSPKELDRQVARKRLTDELAAMDADSLAAVSVLCDDMDPEKALAKLEALRRLGVVKPAVTAEVVIDEPKAKRGAK